MDRHHAAGPAWRRRTLTALGLSLWVASTAAAATATAEPWQIEGEVVRVADGDTLTLRDAQQQLHRIRLAGIDAPERRQAWGPQAREALTRAARRQPVRAACHKHDRYGRAVCTLHRDGHDLGLNLLRAGLAWHYLAYRHEQSADEAAAYAQAEAQARRSAQGLWADDEVVAPWDWRRLERAQAAARRTATPAED
ncbi:MAG: thermonuclease family protein [Burkholderiaceae bacterium]|nr:thermonuclease family protein [Burkholderiaceae bacterium]